MAGSAYLHSPPLSLIADFNHAITYLLSHALRNYISHDLITSQLASPIKLLTKRHQAERHARITCVQQDAGHGEFSGSLLLMEFCQIVFRQFTQAVGQKYNVGVFKSGVHELDRFTQGTFEIRTAVQKGFSGIHLILHGILPRQKYVHLARGRTGKMNEREFAPVFCCSIVLLLGQISLAVRPSTSKRSATRKMIAADIQAFMIRRISAKIINIIHLFQKQMAP